MSDVMWQLLLVFGILLLNGFFVAAEYSLVSVRRTRIQELVESGSKRAGLVLDAVQGLNRYISAIQVGVTMASLAIGWLGEPAVASVIAPALRFVGVTDHTVVHTVAIAVGFLIITFLHVVIGELVPKTIALQRSESVAMRTVRPMRLFIKALGPLIWVLNRSADATFRLLGVEPLAGMHVIHSEEELKMLVSQSSKGGVLQDSEQEMLYNVFDFADKDVAEVMVPRPDVVGLAINEAPAALLHRVLEQPFTRYPVYRETMDDVAGILHVRDLFNASEKYGKDMVRVESLLRPAHVVPESKSLAGLLADFRRSKSHMALVVDEYGSLSGIVTLEDLLEEIVGEIDDEHDVPEKPIERISDNHIRVDGKFPLEELGERFDMEFPFDDYHTIGGFVFGLLGQQPHEGDVVRHENLRIEVTETDGPRIVHVDIIILDKGSKDSGVDGEDGGQPPEKRRNGNGSNGHNDANDRDSTSGLPDAHTQ